MSGRARPLAHAVPGVTGRVIASHYILVTLKDFIRSVSVTCGVSRGVVIESLIKHDRQSCECAVCALVRQPQVASELAR